MSKLLKITSGSEDVLLDDLYYKKGDTYVIDKNYEEEGLLTIGHITSGTKRLRVAVPLPKRVPSGLKMTLNKFSAIIRTTQGAYLDNSSSAIDWTVGYSASINKNTTNLDQAIVTIIKNSEAFANCDNNTPVVASIMKITITFS